MSGKDFAAAMITWIIIFGLIVALALFLQNKTEFGLVIMFLIIMIPQTMYWAYTLNDPIKTIERNNRKNGI